LPDAKKLVLDIPALTLRTGSRDVESLMGKNLLPQGISVPSQVQLQAAFKGSLRAFTSTVRAESDHGAVAGQVSLDSTGAIPARCR